MGLISGLLTLPPAPVRGVAWVGEVVAEEAERALAAERDPRRRLADVQARREAGELTADEADRLEAEIVEEMLEGP